MIKSDTIISVLSDDPHIHSQSSLSGTNTNVSNFTLPSNTVAWGFYLAVGQETQRALTATTGKLINSAAPFVSAIPGGKMAEFGATGADYLALAQGEEHIAYSVTDHEGKQITYGDASKAYKPFTTPTEGIIYVSLTNNNLLTAVDASIRIAAVVVNNQWGERPVSKMHISSRQEAHLGK